MRHSPEPAELIASPLPGWARGLAALFLVLHGWAAWLLHSTVLRTGNDDALYLLLARALRHFSYRDLHIFGSPIHSQYPPAYPALLAVTGGGLGLDLAWPSMTSVALSMIALALVFDLARRIVPLGFALVLLALLSLNDSLLYFAGAVRSEMPYVTLTIAAIWALSLRPGSRNAILLGATLAVLAALTRSIGGTIIGAVGLLWLVQGHYRRAIQFGVASMLTFGAWTAWNFLAPVQFARRSYAMMATGADASVAEQPWAILVQRFERFGRVYALSLPANLSVPSIEGMWIDNVAWLGLIFGLCAIGCYAAWRKAPLIPFYVISYFLFLALWPVKLSRFIVPMIPFVLLLMAWGGAEIAARWRSRGVLAGLALVGVLLVSGESRLVRNRLVARSNCDPTTALVSRDCQSEDEVSFARLMDFVRTRLPDSVVVVTTKEATFGISTGRRVMHPDMAVALFGEDFLPRLVSVGVEYIVINPLVPSHLPTQLLPRCRELQLVEDFPPRTALIRLGTDSSAAAGAGACAVISRLAADTTWLGDRS